MLAKVARAAGVAAGDPVIEVGPGTGALTEKLLDSGACVLALEKDRDFCQLLRQRADWVRGAGHASAVHGLLWARRLTALPAQAESGRLLIVEEVRQLALWWHALLARPAGAETGLPQDAMESNYPRLLEQLQQLACAQRQEASGGAETRPRARVIANLPFSITSELLKQLLPLGDQISHLYLLLEVGTALAPAARLAAATLSDPHGAGCLQHGAADRLTRTRARQQTWRAINVHLGYFCRPAYLFKVPRTVFRPEPHVDAAMTCFELRPPDARALAPEHEGRFVRIVSHAFLQKRKLLTNSLRGLYPPEQLQAAALQAGLSEHATAMDTGVDGFVGLVSALLQGEQQRPEPAAAMAAAA